MPRHRVPLVIVAVFVVVALIAFDDFENLVAARKAVHEWLQTSSMGSSRIEIVTQHRQHRFDLAVERAKNVPQVSGLSTLPDEDVTWDDEGEEFEHDVDAESGFAYVFYATSDIYACSVLVNVHRLQHDLDSVLPIHVLVSSDVSLSLMKAMQDTGAVVHIQKPPPLANNVGGYYQDCLLKLRAFEMHTLSPHLKRVLAFDADQLILRNLDDLFTGLPEVDLAAPRAYWLAKDFFASTFLMINLSDRLWDMVKIALDAVEYNEFDMDLINELLSDTVMMLSGEYVTLNSHWEDWNLPKWYHPSGEVNMTTVEMLNKLSKQNGGGWSPNERHEAVAVAGVDYLPSFAGDGSATILSEVQMRTVPSPTDALPKLADSHVANFEPPSPPPSPSPRFPTGHPITEELFRLQDAAAVIHFSALGKPWMNSAETVARRRTDSHPLLAEQFEMWRRTAAEVCPGGMLSSGHATS